MVYLLLNLCDFLIIIIIRGLRSYYVIFIIIVVTNKSTRELFLLFCLHNVVFR